MSCDTDISSSLIFIVSSTLDAVVIELKRLSESEEVN